MDCLYGELKTKRIDDDVMKKKWSEIGGYCCPCPLISDTFLNITHIYTWIRF
jgi:hypothetical protein